MATGYTRRKLVHYLDVPDGMLGRRARRLSNRWAKKIKLALPGAEVKTIRSIDYLVDYDGHAYRIWKRTGGVWMARSASRKVDVNAYAMGDFQLAMDPDLKTVITKAALDAVKRE